MAFLSGTATLVLRVVGLLLMLVLLLLLLRRSALGKLAS